MPSAIAGSPYSWPRMSAFWHECPICGTGNHLKVMKNRIETIEILGAPGPNWETIQTAVCKGIETREDPEFLHVWLNGHHRAIEARK